MMSTRTDDSMTEYGKQMKKVGVSHIYFVHGTWAGDSPLGFLSRNQDIPFNKLLRGIVKINVDKAMGDLGNYTKSYCDDFQASIGGDIPCDRINWGSGNYHRVRVEGAIKLMEKVAANIEGPSDNERILLFAHSHAGLLFALLTIFLDNEEMSISETDGKMSKMERLVNIVWLDEEINKDIARLKKDINKIDKVFLDYSYFWDTPTLTMGKT